MTFPVYLDVFGTRLHPHLVFESLGYAIGGRLYFRLRKEYSEAPLPLPAETTLWLLVGCIFGAWAGSKLLAWVESPHYYWSQRTMPQVWLGGKTIAGGLLGGWCGVEIAKRKLHIMHSTGDAFVLPLIVGIAIGRLGCFFTGLGDRTYGIPTTLPWGVDFGDGVLRHPTQLYESLFVLLLGAVFLCGRRWMTSMPSGGWFRLFLAAYFAFRVAVEFLKPRELLVGPFSAIQGASLAGVGLSLISFFNLCPTVRTSTRN